MILKNWKRYNEYYNFDETKNRITDSFIGNNENLKINGFISFERSLTGYKRFFCVYSNNNKLYFLAGKNRWNIDEDYSATFKQSGLYSSFTLLHKNIKVYEFKYLTIFRRLFAIIDPAYDFLDLESDNFLLYFSNVVDSIKKDKEHLKDFIKHFH